MSVESRLEDEMEQEMMMEEENRPQSRRMCAISGNGLTLFGYTLPWLVVVVLVIGVLYYLNSQGMLGESVGDALGLSPRWAPPRPMPVPTARPMTGGGCNGDFISTQNRGEIRRFFGH